MAPLLIEPIIYRAKWVMPIIRPLIENGAILVNDNKIRKVDSFDEFNKKGIRGKVVDLGEGVILPALVNAHTHLELSILKGLNGCNFIDWLKAIIEAKYNLDEQNLRQFEKKAYNSLKQTGTGLVADTKNIATIYKNYLFQVGFLEFVGLNEKIAKKRWPRWEAFLNNHLDFMPAAHAPYSVHPRFLKKIKAFARQRNQVISIHVAESEAEVEFLLEGKGVLKDLLIEKGLYDKNFSPPKKRPIPYLASLGLLDQKSLCVHCVEVNQADIEILQKYGAKICFCPRSNTYLGLKEAPWSLFRRVGVLSCLGTDSLASNTDLNLFNEMAYLFKKGAFSPTELIEMATWRGSLALGKNSQFGVLFAGAVARFLFIPLINTKINELGEAVIYMGTKERLRLIEHDSGDK